MWFWLHVELLLGPRCSTIPSTIPAGDQPPEPLDLFLFPAQGYQKSGVFPQWILRMAQ